MPSLADGLPPEIARQVHPDWYKNEKSYWIHREQLLNQYEGQWVAFADGTVIASGRRPVDVFAAAHESGQHPFVICVGHEDEPTRMRRTAFPSDASYLGEALPVLDVEYRQADFAGHERILGCDVLNRFDVLFREPAGEVIINP